jgi:hypothetical protein
MDRCYLTPSDEELLSRAWQGKQNMEGSPNRKAGLSKLVFFGICLLLSFPCSHCSENVLSPSQFSLTIKYQRVVLDGSGGSYAVLWYAGEKRSRFSVT